MTMFRFFSFFFVFLLLFISCSGKKKDHPATVSPGGVGPVVDIVDLKGHIVGTVGPRVSLSMSIGEEFLYEVVADKDGRFKVKIPDKYCQKNEGDLIIVFEDKKRKKFSQKRLSSPVNCSQVLNLGELDLLPLGRVIVNAFIDNRFRNFPAHATATVVGWKAKANIDGYGDLILNLPVGRWDINIVSEGYDPIILKDILIKLPDVTSKKIRLEPSLKMSGVPLINNDIGYYWSKESWGGSVEVGVSNPINIASYRVEQEYDPTGESKSGWIDIDQSRDYTLQGNLEHNRLLFYFADKNGNISTPVPVISHFLTSESIPGKNVDSSDITHPILKFNGFLEKDFGSTIEIYRDFKCKDKMYEKIIEKNEVDIDGIYYKEAGQYITIYLKILNKRNNRSYCFSSSILDYTLNVNYFSVDPQEWPGSVVNIDDFRPTWDGKADDKNFYYSVKVCRDSSCSQECEEEHSPVKSGEKVSLSTFPKGERYICVKANGTESTEGTEWVSSSYPVFFIRTLQEQSVSPDNTTLLKINEYTPVWNADYVNDKGHSYRYNLWASETPDCCITNRKSYIEDAKSGSSTLSLPDKKLYYVCLEQVDAQTKRFYSLTVSEGQISFRNTMPQTEQQNPALPIPRPYKRPALSGPSYKTSWADAKVDDIASYKVSACEDKNCSLNCRSEKTVLSSQNSSYEEVLSDLLPGHSYYVCVETFDSKKISYGVSHSSSFIYINVPMTLEKGSPNINDDGYVGDNTFLLTPSSREKMNFWKGSDGGFFLFGGTRTISLQEEVTELFFNDLWKFSENSWHLIKRSSTKNSTGVYGVFQLPNKDNIPSARRGATVFTDFLGYTWLFGGFGYDSAGNKGYLNDLWRFDGEMWTWMGGSNVLTNDQGLQIFPQGREGAFSWVDDKGVAWLFGGQVGNDLFVNDLWKFENGTFERVVDSNRDLRPHARANGVIQKKKDGQIYLFGGHGISENGQRGYFSDLWSFNGTQWELLFNNEDLNRMGHYSVANQKGVGYPGARRDAFSWIDSLGRFWIMGGFGISGDNHQRYLNDLWYFYEGSWTWVTGSDFGNMPLALGEDGPLNNLTMIGARSAGASWVGSSTDDLWLFGGFGFGGRGQSGHKTLGHLNDLWKITIP